MLYVESRKSFKVRRKKMKLFAECHMFTLGKHIYLPSATGLALGKHISLPSASLCQCFFLSLLTSVFVCRVFPLTSANVLTDDTHTNGCGLCRVPSFCRMFFLVCRVPNFAECFFASFVECNYFAECFYDSTRQIASLSNAQLNALSK
jgi:hypothetical protein